MTTDDDTDDTDDTTTTLNDNGIDPAQLCLRRGPCASDASWKVARNAATAADVQTP
jgi:hypothetical protein